MPDKKLINKKIAEILQQLIHLKEISKLDRLELFGSAKNLYFAERVMERMITAAIDINMHIIGDLRGEIPSDDYGSFIALAKYKIISTDFATKLAGSVSLRNIIVHEYHDLDETKFQQSIKKGLKDYTKYASLIQKWLDNI